jgi:hypothetical protein
MRGLGKQQFEQIKFTESRLVAILGVRPHTYEELRKITRIQRNILRVRLNNLISKKILFKHKYKIQYTQQSCVYGDLYGISSNLPIKNGDYYLLNWSNSLTKEFTDYYYELDPKKLSGVYRVSQVEKYDQSIQFPPLPDGEEPNNNYANTLMKMVSNDFAFTKAKLLLVLDRIRSNQKIHEEDISHISQSIGFFLNHSISLHDILIRCSCYPVADSKNKLYVPSISYMQLWNIIEDKVIRIVQSRKFDKDKRNSLQKFLDNLCSELKLKGVTKTSDKSEHFLENFSFALDALEVIKREFHSVEQILSFPECPSCSSSIGFENKIRDGKKELSDKEEFLFILANNLTVNAGEFKKIAESFERQGSLIKQWKISPEEDKEGAKTFKRYFIILSKFVKLITLCIHLKLKVDHYGLEVPFVEYCFESLYKMVKVIEENDRLVEEDLKIVENVLKRQYRYKEIELRESVDIVRDEYLQICAPIQELEYAEQILKKYQQIVESNVLFKVMAKLFEKYEIPRREALRRSLKEKYSEGAFGSNKYPDTIWQ